jgi:hypothetical protein
MTHEAPPYPPPTDFPKSGLQYLRDRVAEYFESYAVPAVVADIGLKYRSFNLNVSAPNGANRVVFIPGKFDGSNALRPREYGELGRDTYNHASVENPREIVSWERPFTISCWSSPEPGKASDEGATIAKAEDLLEQVVRAVHEACGADIMWGSVIINSPPSENSFGVELLVFATQKGPLFDKTLEWVQATPGLTADDVEFT